MWRSWERAEAPELMDMPETDNRKLLNTLRQFRLTNLLFSRSRALLTRTLLADMRQAPGRAYTLLDLGAGSCDLPLWFLQTCRQHGLKIRITGLELDARTAAFAREQCRAFPEIEIIEGSALDLAALPAYDYVFSNHFLHHLAAAQIPAFLDLVAQKTKRRFLLNDLRRSGWAYWGFTLFAGVWAHDSFTFYDGRLSIQKSFTLPEMRALVTRSTASERMTLQTVFPARLILTGTGTEMISPPAQVNS